MVRSDLVRVVLALPALMVADADAILAHRQ
jgi:hypothetical protein